MSWIWTGTKNVAELNCLMCDLKAVSTLQVFGQVIVSG